MTIGIIGAGGIGLAIAGQLARNSIRVTIANSRSPSTLSAVVAPLAPFVSAGTRAEAADKEIVFIAVPWPSVQAAVDGLGPWSGRIVVDANNAIGPGFKPMDFGGPTSSEVLAGLVDGAQVVKAFNTLRPEVLASDPREGGGRRVIFYSGNHSAAKADIGSLIERLGFAGIDLGTLSTGGRMQQFPGAPLPALNLIRL